MLEIEMTRLAIAQADESRAWYELEQEDLGEEFVDALEAALVAIQKNPRQFPIYHNQVRRYLMSRFPFQIFFDIKPTKIRILRVVHTSRDPGPMRDLLP